MAPLIGTAHPPALILLPTVPSPWGGRRGWSATRFARRELALRKLCSALMRIFIFALDILAI